MIRQTLYLQRWHGYWRVRKPVPKLLIPIIGKGQYLTRSLRTANFNEAKRLAPAVLADFNNIIEQARLRVERAACREVRIHSPPPASPLRTSLPPPEGCHRSVKRRKGEEFADRERGSATAS
jgi:hypothetical protein